MNAPDTASPVAEQKDERPEVPIFEVVIKASIAVGLPLHHFKIFPDGRVEGFEKLGSDVAVINRIPMLLASIAGPLGTVCVQIGESANALIDFTNNIEAEVRRLSKDQQLMEPAAKDPARIEH